MWALVYNLIGIRVRIGVVTVLYVQNKKPSEKMNEIWESVLGEPKYPLMLVMDWIDCLVFYFLFAFDENLLRQ